MHLDEEKKKTVAAWIEEGLKLSEIQSKLASDLDVHLTYMEVRLLVNDLKLMPKDQPTRQSPSQISPKGPETTPPLAQGDEQRVDEELPVTGETLPAGGTGPISVTVDQVARPGALVSGSVTFSDGNIAAWYLDQMGRLGIIPKQQGYRPSQQDLQSFQLELQTQLQKLGF